MNLYGLVGIVVICFIILMWFGFYKCNEGYDYNGDVVSEDDMDKLRVMLRDVDRMFKQNDVIYWMNGGTLLGAVRHMNLIPWDDDADIYIMAKDEEKFLSLRDALNKSGYDIGHFWGGYKVFPTDGKPIKNININADYKFPFIDVFLVKQDGNKFVDNNEKCRKIWPNSYFTYDELYPLRPYKFNDFELVGPHNPIPYLDRMYGKSWRYSAYKGYDHLTESRVPKRRMNLDVNDARRNIDMATRHIPKHTLCIMAIFKNEHEYLEEWLIHHINQGISHFYLYSNDLNIHNYPYLDRYNDYITLIPWVDKKNDGPHTIQRQAYEHCVKNYSDECRYIMMLDIDEFIVTVLPNTTVINVLNLIDYDKTKAIKVQRYNFGSNGHIHKPSGNVMGNYPNHERTCSSYKTIANVSFIDLSKNFYGVHDFPFMDIPGKVYNDYLNYRFTGFPSGCQTDSKNEIPLVINHYYTKSYDEYIKRCKLWKNGGVNTIGYRKDCKRSFKENDKNDISGYDYIHNV